MPEITINGVKTNYLSFGEGKPFLILHGWNSKSERWIPVAEKIAEGRPALSGVEGFRVIVPDLPGFGDSDPLLIPWNTNKYIDFIEHFVEELNLQEFYILGHSFGGALAAKMAIKYPQRVQKLFLVAAAIIRRKTTKKSFSARIAKVVKLLYFLPYYPLFRKAVYKYIIRKSDYIYTEGIMKQTYLNVIGEDVSFQLPFIKVPTVIIWGDKDEDTPIENGRLINEKIKNSKLIVIPGATHRLNKELPEVLAEKVLDNI